MIGIGSGSNSSIFYRFKIDDKTNEIQEKENYISIFRYKRKKKWDYLIIKTSLVMPLQMLPG